MGKRMITLLIDSKQSKINLLDLKKVHSRKIKPLPKIPSYNPLLAKSNQQKTQDV